MRLPHIHMSNGAWIFASAVVVAVIASGGVYAVTNTIMAIGNPSGTTTAYVTPTRQLQTTIIAPSNVVRAEAEANAGPACQTVYTPPAGKAIVVTQVTYDLNSGVEGTDSYAILFDNGCGSLADVGDSIHVAEAQAHTFPTGLPLAGVSVIVGGAGYAAVYIAGYLIPSSQLPPEAPQARGRIKGMNRG